MAVPLVPAATLGVGVPRELFRGEFNFNYPSRSYDASADGQRFVMVQQKRQTSLPVKQIIVIQNWTDELKRRVPTVH